MGKSKSTIYYDVNTLLTSMRQLLEPLSPTGASFLSPWWVKTERILTMVKHLRAQCQSCRKNYKEIQSQKAEADGISSELNTVILPPDGRGNYALAKGEENWLFCGLHFFTWGKLQRRIVFKHCTPILANVLEEILLQDSILIWWEYTILDYWKTSSVQLSTY